MKWFRPGAGGIKLIVKLESLRFGVNQRLLKGLVTVDLSIETDSGSFVRYEASSVGGILARLFFEKLSRVNLAHPR